MKDVTLQLVPIPGQAPEFLATLAVVDPSPAVVKVWEQLPATVVLEHYTRDAWAQQDTAHGVALTVASTDGRHKLPGFVKYLTERGKVAFGRFEKVGLFTMRPQASTSTRYICYVCLDCTKLPGCTLKPLDNTIKSAQAAATPKINVAGTPATGSTGAKRSSGFLGKLVGAQQRTNQHVLNANRATAQAAAAAAGPAATAIMASTVAHSTTAITAPINDDVPKLSSAPAVIQAFRRTMQDQLQAFQDNADEDSIDLNINLAAYTSQLQTEHDKSQISMSILRYIVEEIVDDLMETMDEPDDDEFVVYKQPSAFLDEITLTVYKPGMAPLDVMEELQQGELPDEIQQQQRALAYERQRQVAAAQQHSLTTLQQAAVRYDNDDDDDDNHNVAVLNQQKRDRRTIEDYEREKRNKQARQRG